MKVYLNDSGPAKEAPRSKEGRQAPEKRGGGFKRKQVARAQDVDELLASGADGMEGEEPETEATPEETQERPAKRGIHLGRKKAQAEEPEEPTEPAQEPEPEPEAESPMEEDPQPRRKSFGSGSKKAGKPATAKITVSAPDAPVKEKGVKFGKGAKAPKEPKEPKALKARKQPKEEQAPVMPKGMGGKAPKQPKPAKPPRATSGPKQSSKVKVQDEEEFTRNMAPAGPTVLYKPESVGSQVLSLIEVIAGGCITFYGAMQVGNILINRIMSGM